ncbi:hypothetical protein G9A89_020814 [Geosiphon pyriformis]|nr:hypothetical protein G9A89_020814 [Geosiphon pyriformis]
MNSREPHRLDMVIVPGKSLGWFRLGTSIWDVINFLREQSRLMPSVDFKYSDESPLSTDLFLSLPTNGLHLRFDAASQRLKCIEIFDFSKLRLAYQDSEVSSNKVVPTFLLIYKIFGPTYPGEFDRGKEEYTLNYPGVSFVFPIPEEHISLFTTSSDLPLELPDGTSPLLSHLYIFHGANFRSAVAPPLIRNVNVNVDGMGSGGGSEVGEIESVIARLNRGITINFLSSSSEILLNVTTPQDLLIEIGAPLRVFYKEEDKMRIHSQENITDKSEDVNIQSSNGISKNGINDHLPDYGHPIDYFYNYFHMGFDVLFDGASHRCKKIVLHGNVPGHYDFQRYKRCPYKVVIPQNTMPNVNPNQAAQLDVQAEDDDPVTMTSFSLSGGSQEKYITGDMKIDTIKSLLGQPSGRPLIFNRGSSGQNPFGPTELSGYDGAVFEVMRNQHVATITLF